MIRKLLIANRGEITCRIIRSCRKLGIATVAVFSDADAEALHVEMAGEAVHIGGSAASDSYLNIDNILKAARRTDANAIHPGYGFLAENANFAQAVLDAQLIWVGPQPETIAAMGDKREAKKLLKGIPHVPGYAGDDQSDAALVAAAKDMGFPIMIKAAAGGGGKGMRAVNSLEDLKEALAGARREATQAFGNDMLLLEKYLLKPRHIEVQIIGDHYGNVIVLGERECSIQRRHQKIIEECPAYGLDEEVRRQIHQTALHIARQLNYQNAGTVEFLLDNDGNYYFMEMNTRLQVEHPVTEEVFAIDLVRWQLEIAQGTSLVDLIPPFAELDDFTYEPVGHAVEVRIYAEDPSNNFLPVTGEVLYWETPNNDVRIDAGIRTSDRITTYYDPMLAKVIAHGHNRESAMRKLDYALSQLTLMGIRNNIRFLQRVLMHDEHLSGNISTQFLDKHPDLKEDSSSLPDLVLIAAAMAKGGGTSRWRNNPNRPLHHRFTQGDQTYDVFLSASQGQYTVTIGEREYSIALKSHVDNKLSLDIDGHRQGFTVIEGENDSWWVHSAYGTFKLNWQTPLPLPSTTISERNSLRAPMPGQVISVNVQIGQRVKQGTLLLVMEAMKMEHRIEAPYDGVIERVDYQVGDSVQQDDVLLALKAED